MATIYDVAKLAGVSPATVSRVFNGIAVSEGKTAAVRRAAKALNFTPNRTARSLRRQSSEVIALVIPDIENPYFTELARGVEDVASGAGFSVVLCNSDSQVRKEATYLHIAVAEHMSGVILAPAAPHTDLRAVHDAGRPVVTIDRRADDDLDGVVMDNLEAGRLAAAALADAGHTRIAYIGGPTDAETSVDRDFGWRETLLRRGLPVEEGLRRHTSFTMPGGRQAMDELLRLPQPPDAVVAGSNLIGMGAIQALSSADCAIGLAVIGSLPFTTLSPHVRALVRLPAREMGMTAARMLLERIGGDDQPTRTVVLAPELQTTAVPPLPLGA